MYNFVGIREKRPGKVKARLHTPPPPLGRQKEKKAADPVLVTVSPVPAHLLPTFASKIAWQWRNLYEHSKVAVWTKQVFELDHYVTLT